MYLTAVVLLLLVLPAASVLAEALMTAGPADIVGLIGKWFVFWGVGVRQFLAGVMQLARPQFTAGTIFAIKDEAAHAIVREVGCANLAMGTLGLLSLPFPAWVVPAAIVGGLYYGLAGAGHALRGERNFREKVAMVSDLLFFLVLGAFVALRGF